MPIRPDDPPLRYPCAAREEGCETYRSQRETTGFRNDRERPDDAPSISLNIRRRDVKVVDARHRGAGRTKLGALAEKEGKMAVPAKTVQLRLDGRIVQRPNIGRHVERIVRLAILRQRAGNPNRKERVGD